MTQQELKGLLVEAAGPSCSKQRRDEIFNEMFQQFFARMDRIRTPKGDEWVRGICTALEWLWRDITQNRPDFLPSLFPAFAILLFGEADWSLV